MGGVEGDDALDVTARKGERAGEGMAGVRRWGGKAEQQ